MITWWERRVIANLLSDSNLLKCLKFDVSLFAKNEWSLTYDISKTTSYPRLPEPCRDLNRTHMSIMWFIHVRFNGDVAFKGVWRREEARINLFNLSGCFLRLAKAKAPNESPGAG
jgi:hypothetical protein